MDGVVVRPATTGELRFVRDSWTRSATQARHVRFCGARWVGFGIDHGIEPRTLRLAHRLLVDHLLAEGTVVVVAHEEQPDEALGWACWSVYEGQPLVHYVYVRGPVRRHGLGQLLLGCAREALGLESSATHMTPMGKSLMEAA